MSIPASTASDSAPIFPIDADLAFAALAGMARRKLLVALAKGGPQTGADLITAGRAHAKMSARATFLDSTLKNLKPMVEAGLVVQLVNPQDKRRPLYALSPAVKVTVEGEQTVFDLGFCVVRLAADGK